MKEKESRNGSKSKLFRNMGGSAKMCNLTNNCLKEGQLLFIVILVVLVNFLNYAHMLFWKDKH